MAIKGPLCWRASLMVGEVVKKAVLIRPKAKTSFWICPHFILLLPMCYGWLATNLSSLYTGIHRQLTQCGLLSSSSSPSEMLLISHASDNTSLIRWWLHRLVWKERGGGINERLADMFGLACVRACMLASAGAEPRHSEANSLLPRGCAMRVSGG